VPRFTPPRGPAQIDRGKSRSGGFGALRAPATIRMRQWQHLRPRAHAIGPASGAFTGAKFRLHCRIFCGTSSTQLSGVTSRQNETQTLALSCGRNERAPSIAHTNERTHTTPKARQDPERQHNGFRFELGKLRHTFKVSLTGRARTKPRGKISLQ
jgi:hypothetical protein